MSVKLKSITEKSWLVIGDTEDTRIGLLTEIRDQYVLMVEAMFLLPVRILRAI